MQNKSNGFGTAPVFFTAISTILGAILFLRYGYAVGTLGFMGVILVVLVGHLVTVPTSLAISEIASNQKVEGGGEYYIISRSFGLNIGATIGISLYLSQAISVAFYVIAFTEAFAPVFDWLAIRHNIFLPRQLVSVPAMLILSLLILKKGANLGVKALYVVVAILFVSLLSFFIGKTDYQAVSDTGNMLQSFRSGEQFFLVFAIIFPAFTGMTAGVGLSGDLRDPGKSIPKGTIMATLSGMLIYIFIAWKMHTCASPYDLINDQLVMSQIAVWGKYLIPLGLAASTISSALGSILVAPRTLQALGSDRAFPFRGFNSYVMKGKGAANEPFHGTLVTSIIAMVFVIMGDINAVAKIITMFFMVTYGSLCLISFLYHFGADPSYRPVFRSKWYISLLGFVMCVWLMFKINTPYALLSIAAIVLIYIIITNYHKDRKGLEVIFKGAFFMISNRLQVFLQKSTKAQHEINTYRPAAVCVSEDSFEREKALDLLTWVGYKYGFGTYIHLIKGYYSSETAEEAKNMLKKLLEKTGYKHSNIYIDTLISPSYTSAIAQIVQLPGISGMENNMIMFEFSKHNPDELPQIVDNISLVRAGNFDVCVMGSSSKQVKFRNGIHIWIKYPNSENATLMILLSYIILGHPEWKKADIRIFNVCNEDNLEENKKQVLELLETGRLPISQKNIEFIITDEEKSLKSIVNEKSAEAGLTMIGFLTEQIKHEGGEEIFKGYDKISDILFVNAKGKKNLA